LTKIASEPLMEIEITIIYGICDEFLQAMGHRGDPKARGVMLK